MSWSHIVSAVQHEMFPKMSTSIDMVIQKMKDDEKWNDEDLSEETVDKVIERLKKERNMTTNQVARIKNIVSRARAFMRSLVTLVVSKRNGR